MAGDSTLNLEVDKHHAYTAVVLLNILSDYTDEFETAAELSGRSYAIVTTTGDTCSVDDILTYTLHQTFIEFTAVQLILLKLPFMVVG